MSIRKRPSKKNIGGFTYQVYFPYINASGEHCVYRKGGFADKNTAQEFETFYSIHNKKFDIVFINDCNEFEEYEDMFKDYEVRTYNGALLLYK